MRRLVTGVDEQGRSCIVEEGEVSGIEFVRGVLMHGMYETHSAPPPQRPPGTAPLLPQRVPPGIARWYVVHYAPEVEVRPHLTTPDATSIEAVRGHRRHLGLSYRLPTHSSASTPDRPDAPTSSGSSPTTPR
jgi:hypothetical protein